MKNASSSLFDLIKSLSHSERRYLRLYLLKHSKNKKNRYTQLFDKLCCIDSYNEKNLLDELKPKIPKNDFAVLKKQLYEQLLHGLAAYDLFGNPEQQLFRSIFECKILMRKGLFGQAETKLKVISQKADLMDMQEIKLLIHQLRLQLIAKNYYRHSDENSLEFWNHEAENIIHKLNTSLRYKYLSNKVYQMQYASGVRGKGLAQKMESIIQKIEFQNMATASTQQARLDFFQINALYHFTNSNPQKAYEYNAKLLTELEASPHLMKINADRYFSVLNNFLIDCFMLKAYETLEEGLIKLKSLSEISTFKKLSNFEANSFRLSSQLQINYWMEQGNFDAIINSIPEIESGIKRFENKLVIHTRFTLLYLLAYSSFIVGQFDEAIDLLNPILNEKENKVVEDIQFGARVLQLLCFFEKKEMLLLHSLIQSIRKTIIQRRLNLPIHQLVFKQLQTKISKRINFTQLNLTIESLAENPNQKNELSLFNFLLWAKSKSENKSMQSLWQQQNIRQ